MKVAGRGSELKPWKLCGRRNTKTGPRGQEPACPSGSVSDLAKRPETQRLLKMRRVVKHHQQNWKKRKRKKKRRRKKRRRKKKSKPNLFLQLQTSDLLDIPDWSRHLPAPCNTNFISQTKPNRTVFPPFRNIGCAF